MPASAPAPAAEPDAVPADATRRARLAEAVRDRLPLWVRTRCGVEPRALAALTLALAAALGFAVHHFWSGRPLTVQAPPVESASRSSPVPSPAPPAAPSSAPAPAAARSAAPGAVFGGGPLLVDVAGEVRRPGVHRLPAGARVADALRAAGGVRPGTDLHGLNRARPLADGEQIVVGEPPVAPVPGPPAAAAGSGPAAGGPVSLNSATADQLDTLPGIGPVMARRIIDHRTERGGFSSVEELREVSGIGERRFAELKPLVGP
ncbi:helix-hairpin-helix domain-containing protein [Streptomyces sp. HK10]|uniref:helix-hairpin-helix domain-containing protein n=1 Tax=Streptomyces sp. HK10 TaxID=3373255 RepID=UPI003749BACF